MSEENLVLVERKEGYAEVVLNRPDRRNSIIAPLSVALREAIEALSADDEVNCILLRGEGGYFCSGIDLKALQAEPPPPWRDQQGTTWRDLHIAMFRCEKPIIGAFESYGINAGAALALACDLLIAGESSFLQIGEIQQGARAPMNAAWLRLKTSEQVIARLVFLGDRVPAPEMHRLGLTTECVSDEGVVARCREIAERIAGFPAGAAHSIKQDIINQRPVVDPDDYFKTTGSPALLTAGKVT